jgi:ATP-binding cassette, subfamily G (WHITE), member 2, PDR
MYRLSPLTYIVGGISATGLHGKPVQCDQNEILVFDTPSAAACGNYLQSYLTQAPGQLLNPAATSECQYCPLSNSDQFLALSSISWDDRWVKFGIVWAYIGFNIIFTIILYYVFRVKVWKWPKPLSGWSFRFKQT